MCVCVCVNVLTFVKTCDRQDVKCGPKVQSVWVVALRRCLLVDQHDAAYHVVGVSLAVVAE